ncbi:uncharacterized protein LOC128953306 [Oppia nitens]|uniref:uncharacterized protein LOC128953306 n=1 Tax=Oppia nitens TaxID=1686743 RepID=UPI0023D98B69|nr:uncharacterized protein LOC128953306 [Oppia nitens]
MKQQGLDYMAVRQLGSCLYDIQDTVRCVSAINQVEDPKVRHQFMIVETQWTDFWTNYYTDFVNSQQNCSMEDIVDNYKRQNQNDLATLGKLLDEKRKEVLQEMQLEIKNDNNADKQDIFWIPLDTLILDDAKRGFENDDKRLSKISDQSIKLKTLYMLLNTLDYTLGGYKAIHSQ